jgi:NhaP-type Na+/H+ or K+/H+ antiporter
VFPTLLFFLDALLLPSFLARCAALYATGWGSDEVVRQVYAVVLWRTCVAYCLGRVLLWGGHRALRRLDALYKEVRESDQYVRSEQLLNRDETAFVATEV